MYWRFGKELRPMSGVTALRGAWAGLLLLSLVSLTGCSGDPGSPDVRIRVLIDAVESAVESGEVRAVMARLHPAYRDRRHAGPREAMGTLFAVTRRHRGIHLFTMVKSLQVSTDGQTAEVTVVVASAGRPIESVDALVSVEADLHRFDLQLVADEDEWLIKQSDWSRVGFDAL